MADSREMGKCDECGRVKPIDYFTYPGGSIAQLCKRCADDAGFDFDTRELKELPHAGGYWD